MDDADELRLIERCQAGDQAAFSELFETHQSRVLRMALQMMRSEEAALDVSQEVFLRAFAELRYWRGAARFSTWLYRAALNVCFERIRAEEKQRKIRGALPNLETSPSPEVHAASAETLAAIDEAIKTLPSRQRMVFVMKQYEDLRFSVIADHLEITEGGAKASYHKALMTLRERLKHLAPVRVL